MTTQTELPDANNTETPTRRGRPPKEKTKRARRNFVDEVKAMETNRGIALMLLRNLPVTDATRPIIDSITDLLSPTDRPQES